MTRSSCERIVGDVPEHEKESILKRFDDRFDQQQFDELVGKEREKTADELQIINLANQATNRLRKRYGLDNFEISPKNIHVIKESAWPQNEKGSAFYVASLQSVATREQESKLVFLRSPCMK